MAIVDPAAIKYSNETMRPMCDLIARTKFRAEELKSRWDAISGNNDEKLALLSKDIVQFCDLASKTARRAEWAELLWDSLSLNPLFPNDANEELWDNGNFTGQDPNRPPLTGQDCVRIKRRIEEFGNYFTRGTDLDKQWVATGVLPVINDYLKDVIRMTGDGSQSPTGGWANQVVNGRCADILQQYETDQPNKFGHILAGAVNP